MDEFLGYERPDGSVGIRNYVVVLPSVSCVNNVAQAIAREVPEAVPLCHSHGCGRGGKDAETHYQALVNIGKNPNVAAVLVLGLGCEVIKGDYLAQAIGASGKPLAYLGVQEEGGSRKAAAKGAEVARGLLAKAGEVERKPHGIDKLVLGLNCGGSDAFSGVTANPAVGVAADWVVENGGTVLLTETTEMIGTAHILQRRSEDPTVGQRIVEMVAAEEKAVEAVLGPLARAVISPGNMDGGMSSIREKSLGSIAKGGTSPVRGVVGYGETPKMKGLVIMDGPGFDSESVTGEAAAGAQAIIFTTGRGTPIGFPIVPVIKVASNSNLYQAMNDDMDFNAGRVLEGPTLAEVGGELVTMLKAVLNGERTKAEINQPDSLLHRQVKETAF